MYLMIENKGECPIEGFTVLGLSTARGNDSAIGQFGSGAKHSVLLLLRNRMSLTIYSGTSRIKFGTKPCKMGKTSYSLVTYQIDNSAPKDMNCSLEFGSLDWDNVGMALREFISNAIDASGIEGTVIELTEKPRAKKGYTRVFIEANDAVKQYFNNLDKHFLQYRKEPQLATTSILEKSEQGPARIYRKGVFVRSVKSHDSLFDYNFGSELKIDEARNLDDYYATSYAAMKLARNKESLKSIFRLFEKDSDLWEMKFNDYYLCTNSSDDVWQEAWSEVYGKNVPVTNVAMVKEYLTKKGVVCVMVPDNWCKALVKHGIENASLRLSNVESRGCVLCDKTSKAVKNLDDVWSWLQDINMTEGKNKPSLQCFEQNMDACSRILGYYENDTVFINIENDSCRQTMLEELVHYITGSTDLSRDFQDFALKAATRFAKLVFE